ncbi:MAG: isoleucine--tRNA ligase, partial [Deltaproteobacteria bacterium]
PRKSWFIRTTAFKEEMLANNRAIRWYPAHIQTGRFGNFLESNVDWALSRERFWGTPLPIWVCEETGYREAIGSYAELLAKPDVTGLEMWEAAKAKHPDLSEHLKVHKPYIDAITYASPKAPGKRMRRVPEVIDCWFDSGAMPFAQWGWPHRGEEDFRDQFPADFISEAIDQTRGWFYSLLAISTLLFSERAAGASSCTRPYPHPYKNCIVLGHVLGEDGQKMSKSRGNVCDPWDVFDHQGADALRWYFLSAAPPWNPRPFSERLVAEVVQKFLGTFKNTYAFFVLYANIDGFDPARDRCDRPPETLPLHLRHLDRWLLSEFHRLIRTVREEMEDFDATRATRAIEAFLEDLSNWWLRRSRNRFWRGELTVEKRWAYTLLYDVLEGLVRLCAPFVPFITEDIYQNLVRSVYPDAPESVHLSTYPEHDADRIDDALARKMTLLRQIVGLGRSARNTSKIKNRQPLARLVVGGVEEEADFRELLPLLQEELNVKTVTTGGKREAFLSYAIKPNFKALGASAHGRHIPRIKEALAHLEDPTESARRLQGGEILSIEIDGETVPLSADLVEIVPHPKPGWVVAEEGGRFVALDTEITEELRLEGYAAELINKIQFMRKNANFEVTDRIRLYYSENDTLERVFAVHGAHIEAETLAVTTRKGIPQDEEGVNVKTWRVNDLTVTLGVERVG